MLLRRELGEADAATAELAARAARSLAAAARSRAPARGPGVAPSRCSSAPRRWRSDAGTRSALRRRSAPRCSRPAASPRPRSACSTPRSPARPGRARPRAGGESSASSLGWSPRPRPARRARRAGRGRAAAARARGRRLGQCRAWSLRAQADWFAGRVERADDAWEQAARTPGAPARSASASAPSAGAPPPPCSARRRSTRPSGAARRSATRSGSAPSRSRRSTTRSPRCTPCSGDFALRRAPSRGRRRDAASSSTRSTGPSRTHEALVRLLAGQPRGRRAALPRRHRALSDDARPRAAGHHRGDARAGAVRARALPRGGRADPARGRHRTADDIVTQSIWRGVQAKLLARARPATTRPRVWRAAASICSSPPTCSPIAATRCSTSPRCWPHAASKWRIWTRSTAALAQYEQKGNLVGAARARAQRGER